MIKTIALSAAAVVALTGPVLAGAHTNASDNGNRSSNAQGKIDSVPPGLQAQLARGNSAFAAKSGNSGK